VAVSIGSRYLFFISTVTAAKILKKPHAGYFVKNSKLVFAKTGYEQEAEISYPMFYSDTGSNAGSGH
jgi:hypothetical protein